MNFLTRLNHLPRLIWVYLRGWPIIANTFIANGVTVTNATDDSIEVFFLGNLGANTRPESGLWVRPTEIAARGSWREE